MRHDDAAQPAAGANGSAVSPVDAVVVGAGFAGMYMLHRLRSAGLTVQAFETGSGVGGTWYWNRYPGARVDGPSMQYSYSFSSELEQEWRWSEHFASQQELERYANHVADRFDLRRDIAFDTSVTAATFDESCARWLVQTDRGHRLSARFFITAVGCLASSPNRPDLPGLESFAGQWYHTARWPKEGLDLTGKRVAIIGTGSTGIQAIPELAAQAAHLTVFQRTANYSMPSNNRPMEPEFEREWKRRYGEYRAAARQSWFGSAAIRVADRSALEVPEDERTRIYEEAWGEYAGVISAFRDVLSDLDANETAAAFVRQKIRSIVTDAAVAERLCPVGYPLGAKRMCIDSGYFETYNRDNVTLIALAEEPITGITASGITTSARQVDVDVLVFATGFDAMTGPLLRIDITGRGGTKLRDKWHAGPVSYLGLAVAGFPNMFTITGPGSPSVLTNMMTSIEQHVEWIGDAIDHLRAHDLQTMEADADAERQWGTHVNEAGDRTLYKHADSWYLGANIPGKPRVFMPYAAGAGVYRQECEEIVADGYRGFRFWPDPNHRVRRRTEPR